MKKAIFTTALVALCACSPNLEFSVKKRWTKSVRNFAMLPVYPMREDIFIGSVRLVLDEDEPFNIQSRNYGYIDLSDALAKADGNLPNFPKTGDPSKVTLSDGTKGTVSKWAQPTDTGGIFRSGQSPTQRLRLAALPGVSVVRISSADLVRRNLLSAITGAFRQEANLNIDLSGVETAEIDDVTAFRAFNNDIVRRFKTDPWFAHSICQSATTLNAKDAKNLRLQMVIRAFYARGIIYKYGNSVGASLNGGQGINPLAGVQTDPDDKAPTPVATTLLSDAGATPGTAARISTYGAQGSTLSEVFERPMAFGVSAIAFAPVGDTYGLGCESGKAVFNDSGKRLGFKGSDDIRGFVGTGDPAAAPAASPAVSPAARPSLEPFSGVPTCQSLRERGVPDFLITDQARSGQCTE